MAKYSTEDLANLSYKLGLASGHISGIIPFVEKLERGEGIDEVFDRLNAAEREMHAARLILIGPIPFGEVKS